MPQPSDHKLFNFGHDIWRSSDRSLTKKVSTMATISTEYQERRGLPSSTLSLMINKIFIQNASAGATIKRVDRNNEDTSGPKINLPPKKNICMIQTTITVNSFSYSKLSILLRASNSIFQVLKVHHTTVL